MTERNTQLVEPPTRHGQLDVVDIWQTIQGEGPLVGSPAVFVRLAGCNLNCPACDTDYTSNRQTWGDLFELSQIVTGQCPVGGIVVITGGEPMRQHGLIKFVNCLLSLGNTVQIETNGILCLDLPYGDPRLVIVCSPKTPRISPDLAPRLAALKYIVRYGEVAVDGLPRVSMGYSWGVARPPVGFTGVVYVQPLDEGEEHPAENERNRQAAVTSCLTHGYRLCLQTHKLLGLK